MKPIILASASPRRASLLETAGIPFEIYPPWTVEREPVAGEKPVTYCRQAASSKCRAVSSQFPDRLVLGADTIVVADSKILGKPSDLADSERMIRFLSGRSHRVNTALALHMPDRRSIVRHSTTNVTFRVLSENEIRWYVESREGLDKAGAYGIQGLGGCLIKRINGCYFNVVGMPLALLIEMLQVAIPSFWPFYTFQSGR